MWKREFSQTDAGMSRAPERKSSMKKFSQNNMSTHPWQSFLNVSETIPRISQQESQRSLCPLRQTFTENPPNPNFCCNLSYKKTPAYQPHINLSRPRRASLSPGTLRLLSSPSRSSHLPRRYRRPPTALEHTGRLPSRHCHSRRRRRGHRTHRALIL